MVWLPSWRKSVRLQNIFISAWRSCLITTVIKCAFLFLLIYPRLSTEALATNVSISNVEIVERDSAADTTKIEFDVEWENAWNDSINHDALWVFFKYSLDFSNTYPTWNHATLKSSGTNPSGFSSGSTTSSFTSIDLIVPNDKKGLFIKPATSGSGSVDFNDIQVVWDYGQDGVSDAQAIDATDTEVKVFAFEMVYVASGGFYLGDGSSGSREEFEYDANLPGAITGQQTLVFDDSGETTPNVWYYNTDDNLNDDANGATFTVSDSFPQGYNGFYLMKYELSQGQYRDFLNTLTQAEQSTRVQSTLTDENDANTYVMIAEGTTIVSNRQTIKAGTNPTDGNPYTFGCDLDDDDTVDELDDGEWIAMNYVHWMDLAAVADWAALRPYTELEYEKAARGPTYPVDGEHAGGTTSRTDADTIINAGANSEVVFETGEGLINFDNDGVIGPIRSGFAATASTVRDTATGGFYGALDLSGNLWEMTVTIGSDAGRSFGGSHGDGVLVATSSFEGNATNIDWPGILNTAPQRGVSQAGGSGQRGGAYDETSVELIVSTRNQAASEPATRAADLGIRLARSEDS
jgi:formylglycine-generating enzyme required for sulfatase activity